ncbi:MAG: hypothetical protein IPL98_07780 [Saprospiraceae bacterium]|nr:hypothetical protein [Saprospiraceae bacterium]
MFCLKFFGLSQSREDNTGFKLKKLKFEEATLVSSYYTQNGNHSAVTGGIGTEKLNDSSNSFGCFLAIRIKKSYS